MKMIFPEPNLEPGESVYCSWLANRTQNNWRAVGGKLFLTTTRLIFQPNQIDAKLGGNVWETSLSSINRVGHEPRRLSLFELFSGGLRTRLKIETHGKFSERFVVNQISEIERIITDAVTQTAKL